ncbi:endonuclease/exonuclease/phosphatase family protein [Corynebacterium sp. sy017]|uniref:endonuclease/exonuclease/phosphatase family protein n=1 Tax=unclassified Corynebacterium TaxID=2624378 RepID=UPI001185863F|nr:MULTISPECIES: endonuclease/exonuclease/phosphatase family protein [unclassified Corynebacterium]MBP3087938.1 endonuclease/exonuclease/phosphatase family protein [Corynebacterium sp. sy017]QDZ42901.1 endonuclease/exonuclease/phosphatase family protein [Corynebacterium sp. sy039]TSD92474.1 endonuclease/exonuclease/phosphatase family protein [Corynebacterium sp. SY003]
MAASQDKNQSLTNNVRRIIAFLLILIGFIWFGTIILPKHYADSALPVPQIQASAFLGAITLITGIGLLRSFRRALIILIIAMLSVVLIPRVPMPFQSAHKPTTRVMSLNTFFAHADDRIIAQKVTEISPDILILIETNPEEVAAIAEHTGYTALNEAQPGGGASAVVTLVSAPYLEKLQRDNTWTFTMVDNMTIAQMPQLELAQGTRIVGVHPVAPLLANGTNKLWSNELESLARWAHSTRQQQSNNADLVLLGDFNSTRAHPQYRELGLADCTGHLAHKPTWPQTLPVIRIDHILSTARCADGGTVNVQGTDHLGVWADVEL